MTGKTHMAISTAAVAIAFSATGVRASGSAGYLLPPDLVKGGSGLYSIAGLLLLGLVAGLFPDLDAPDTELQHLPRRVAARLGRYATAGMGGRSPLARFVQGFVGLLALPFTLTVWVVGRALRAFTRHRGFTHTLLGMMAFTSLVMGVTFLIAKSVQLVMAIGAVWMLGYASHLAADACTPAGIPLLGTSKQLAHSVMARNSTDHDRYTGRRRPREPVHNPDASTHNNGRYSGATTFHLLPEGMRVRTGTIVDTLLIRWSAWAACAAAVTIMLLT